MVRWVVSLLLTLDTGLFIPVAEPRLPVLEDSNSIWDWLDSVGISRVITVCYALLPPLLNISGGATRMLSRELRLNDEAYMNPSLGGQAGRTSKTSALSNEIPGSIYVAAALSPMVISKKQSSWLKLVTQCVIWPFENMASDWELERCFFLAFNFEETWSGSVAVSHLAELWHPQQSLLSSCWHGTDQEC